MLKGFENYTPIINTKFDQSKYNWASKDPREVNPYVFSNTTLEPGLSKIFLFITLICSWCLSSLMLCLTSIAFTIIVCLSCYILSKLVIEYDQIDKSPTLTVSPIRKYMTWRPIFDLPEKICLAQAIFTFILILASLYKGFIHLSK
jgi:hypothetical protein